MSQSKAATCSCGQLSVEVAGEPLRSSVCHCYACQKRTGSAFGAQLRFKSEQVRLTGELKTWQREADSGNQIETSFCPHCGSTLVIRFLHDLNVVAVPLGGFSGQYEQPPVYSIYEARKLPWIEITGATEHFD